MNEQATQSRKKSRRTLLAILAVAALPVVAAYFAFFTGIGVPAGTVNAGALLSEALSLKALLPSEAFARLEREKKWRILLPLGETCDQQCRDNFYTTRQVHVRLGEKGTRLERLAVNYGGAAGAAILRDLKPDHPRLQQVTVERETWRQWRDTLADHRHDADAHVYLLVDQEGFAMMAYSDQHGNALLKDIKRALKYSIDYQ